MFFKSIYIMKILFVCNQGRNRSKTAAYLFKDRFETKYAGLFSENPVDIQALEWADLVVVMEDFQREEIGKRFPSIYLKKKIIFFNIKDFYNFNDFELIKLLESKMEELVKPILE